LLVLQTVQYVHKTDVWSVTKDIISMPMEIVTLALLTVKVVLVLQNVINAGLDTMFMQTASHVWVVLHTVFVVHTRRAARNVRRGTIYILTNTAMLVMLTVRCAAVTLTVRNVNLDSTSIMDVHVEPAMPTVVLNVKMVLLETAQKEDVSRNSTTIQHRNTTVPAVLLTVRTVRMTLPD